MLTVQLDWEKLSLQFTEKLEAKHQWQWQKHLLPTIEEVKKEFPNLDDRDIAKRVGDDFINWDAQEIKDNQDWEESLEEVAKEASLNEQQKAEFRNFLTGYTED